MMLGSENRLNRKGSTASSESGPPNWKRTTAMLASGCGALRVCALETSRLKNLALGCITSRRGDSHGRPRPLSLAQDCSGFQLGPIAALEALVRRTMLTRLSTSAAGDNAAEGGSGGGLPGGGRLAEGSAESVAYLRRLRPKPPLALSRTGTVQSRGALRSPGPSQIAPIFL